MKIHVLLFLLFACLDTAAQITTYEVLNANDSVVTTYQKHRRNDSTVTYYAFIFKYKEVTVLDIVTHRIDPITVRISESFSIYSARNATFKDRADFMKNSVAQMNRDSLFVRERWDYYYRDDSIQKIELTENERFSQLRVFSYGDNYCKVDYHSIRDGEQKESYAYDSIALEKNGKLLERHYFRWEEPVVTYSCITSKRRRVYDDSLTYATITYHYNHWTLNDHLIAMQMGEGPMYTVQPEIDDRQLIRTSIDKDGKELKVKRSRGSNGSKVLVYTLNGEFLRKIRITDQ